MYKVGKQLMIDNGEDLNETRFGFHWPPFHSISHLHLHVLCPIGGLSFYNRLIYKPNSMWFVSVSKFKCVITLFANIGILILTCILVLA